MSTDTSDRDYPDSPYRRDDWHGSATAESCADHSDSGMQWHQRTRRQEKAAHVAHALLRGIAPPLCAVTCADPDRTPVELDEPQHYPPGEGNRQHLRAIRANAEEGYLTGGESTAVVLDGVPTEPFIGLVETWLEYCVREGHIGRELADQLRADAQSLKQGTDKRDEQILQLLVEDVLAGERSTPG